MDFLLRLARDVDDIKRDIAALRSAMRYRRAIGSVLMERDLISAVGGTLFVSKSAASVYVPMVVPTSGTWTLTVQDPPGGGFHFANSDICRITARVIDGDDYDTKETWFTVSSRVDNGDSTQSYTCAYQSGDKGYTYPSGAPVIGYGQSGDGYLMLTCDGANAPRYSIYTHEGSPWSAETERGRFGNMNGAFGVTTDVMGFGVGDYSAGNYLKYDTSGGFAVKAGGGTITIDDSAITFDVATSPYNFIRFLSGANLKASISGDNAGNLTLYAAGSTRIGSNSAGEPTIYLMQSTNTIRLGGGGGSATNVVAYGGLNIGTATGAAAGNIEMSGSIKESTAIGARVYNSSNITLTTGVNIALTLDSERFDNDNIHSTSSNTSRLTCQTAGVYLITGTARFEANATGIRFVGIRLNGSTFIAASRQGAVSGAVTNMSVSTIYALSVSDYVELVVSQTSGSNLNIVANGNDSPEFAMVRLA